MSTIYHFTLENNKHYIGTHPKVQWTHAPIAPPLCLAAFPNAPAAEAGVPLHVMRFAALYGKYNVSGGVGHPSIG